MTNGRAKGNRFENAVCSVLSAWFVDESYATEPLSVQPFRRRSTAIMPLEGHWNGKGDILNRPDAECPFCIECKNIEGWELDGLLGNEKWPPWKWWEQAVAQAGTVLHPLLLFTRNRRPIYAMLDQGVFECLHVPAQNPVLTVRRPGSEPLALLLLSDLARSPRKYAQSLVQSLRSRSKK